MHVFSYHLVPSTPSFSLRTLMVPPGSGRVPGLLHAECMAAMTLGAPILSPQRLQLRRLAVFARWESESALEAFLADTPVGRVLASGWHLRLAFLRRWGQFPGLNDLPEQVGRSDPDLPVVAVTLARLKLPHLFRFIHWGRPVEEQVRDHPATSLALASFRPVRTFSTFSIWQSQQAMTEMVHGPDRHASAMRERDRRDFHHAFITLRFRALSEHGEWKGRSGWVPRPQATPTSE